MTHAPGVVQNWQVRMHDLIARGVAEVRQRQRLTQEQAARLFRFHGLASWRTSTVGSLEAGLRRPRLDEVVLICAALGCSLDELLPDTEEWVELGDGAAMTPRAIRTVVYGAVDASPDYDSITREMRFPGEDKLAAAMLRSRPERERLEELLAAIRQHAAALTGGDWRAAFRAPTDAERHAARRLGYEPAQVILATRALWHRDFTEERDSRVGNPDELEPRSRQARRGLITRAMLSELGEFLGEAYGTAGKAR